MYRPVWAKPRSSRSGSWPALRTRPCLDDLFNGYGVGYKGRPLHAGFLGQDVLLVHDEAHLEEPCQRLATSIEAVQEQFKGERVAPSIRVMALTATPRGVHDPVEITTADHEAAEERLAGMVRHLAIAEMKRNPPRGVSELPSWLEQYVAGHQEKAKQGAAPRHSQLSYVPLPSIGHAHTDPGVRRVMLVAPVGDDEILEHLARQIDGRGLEPEHAGDLRGPVFLSRVRHDGVISGQENPLGNDVQRIRCHFSNAFLMASSPAPSSPDFSG